MNNRVKELLQNTALFGIANMGSRFLVFLMMPLYTYALSTEEYGISDIVQSTASFLFPLLTLMISDAVLRFAFLREEYDIREVFSIGFRYTIYGSVLCVLLTFVFSLTRLNSLGYYVFFVPIMFTANSFAQLLHKFARGINCVRISAEAGLIGTFTIIITNLVFLLALKLGVLGFLIAYSLGDFISFIYIFIRCDAKIYLTSNQNYNLLNQMFKYSAPLAPNSLSWWALSCLNRYIMFVYLGASAVGIYSATLRIPTILTAISDIFSQAWLLSALKEYGTEESKLFIRNMHNRFFSILLSICALLIILARPISSLLLSGEFVEYWYMVPFLFISVFLGALAGFLGSIFCAEKKNITQVVSTFVGALTSILISLLFLKPVGVIIIPISTFIGYFVIWIIRRSCVKEYINIGYGILHSTILISLLLIESVFVSCENYFLSMVFLVVIFLCNMQQICSTLKTFVLYLYKVKK